MPDWRKNWRRDRGECFDGYDIVDQWTSYGWNVFTLTNGNDYGEVAAALKAMDAVDPHDRRPSSRSAKRLRAIGPRRLTEKSPAPARQLVSYPAIPTR